MNTAIDKSIYGQIKTKGEQLAELVKMAEDIQNNNDKNAAEVYQRGLEDAWEAARKIIRMPDGDILDLFPDCYASVCTAVQAILKYDASEAIAKLKAYEEKQKAEDEIKVGDGVIVYGLRGVVTCVNGNLYTVMMSDGSCGNWRKRDLKKTGKHYDIDKILEAMKQE